MNISMEDIAKIAKVHKSAVSKALNNYPDISIQTKNRIMEIVKELNYRPNVLAQRFSKQRAYAIGIFIPGMGYEITYSFGEVMKGIGAGAYGACEYEVLLKVPKNQDERHDFASLFERHKVDGAAIIFPELDDLGITTLEEKKIPAVLINSVSDKLDYIKFDNLDAARKVMNHLITSGRKRIAFINFRHKKLSFMERFEGYKAALEEHGMQYREELVRQIDPFTTTNYNAMKELLQYKPDAVFMATEHNIWRIHMALQEAGVMVPEDIAVAGIDDIPESSSLIPSITTVRQPFLEMGKQSVAMLIKRIEKNPVKQQKKVIQGELIVRDGTI